MPLNIQAKILRLLQEKSIERLGGRETIPTDVRIIAATNRDLEDALSEGRFREDLYYRLKVVTILLPRLCDRRSDIPLLTEYFMSQYASELGIDNPGITREAKALLDNYSWPGNIRELANTIQRILIFNRGTPISCEDISQAISGNSTVTSGDHDTVDQKIHEWAHRALTSEYKNNLFDSCMDDFAAILISEALTITGGNRSQTAKLLGLSRPTLHSKINKYHLKLETSVKKE